MSAPSDPKATPPKATPPKATLKKTLLPELLPAPQAAPGPDATPPQRVAERARLLLQRFRGLGTTAGAAILSLHCGAYGVVDPLPPPARQCAQLPDHFSSINVLAYLDLGTDAGLAPVRLELQTSPVFSGVTGLGIDAVRVNGGTALRVEDLNARDPRAGNWFRVTIAPDSASSTLLVEVDLSCAGAASAATTTKRYHIVYHPFTSPSDLLMVEELPPN